MHYFILFYMLVHRALFFLLCITYSYSVQCFILSYVLLALYFSLEVISSMLTSGWDETIFLRRDRDREIRFMKIHYETETEKKWMLIFLTRQDRDATV